MFSIFGLVFLLGILNLIFKSTLSDPDPAENRIEWIATILMQCNFFVLFAAWRKTRAEFSVRIGPA
jgi:hypothetical protein